MTADYFLHFLFPACVITEQQRRDTVGRASTKGEAVETKKINNFKVTNRRVALITVKEKLYDGRGMYIHITTIARESESHW